MCGLARGEMQDTGQRHVACTTGLVYPREIVGRDVLVALTTEPEEKCGLASGQLQDAARVTPDERPVVIHVAPRQAGPG